MMEAVFWGESSPKSRQGGPSRSTWLFHTCTGRLSQLYCCLFVLLNLKSYKCHIFGEEVLFWGSVHRRVVREDRLLQMKITCEVFLWLSSNFLLSSTSYWRRRPTNLWEPDAVMRRITVSGDKSLGAVMKWMSWFRSGGRGVCVLKKKIYILRTLQTADNTSRVRSTIMLLYY